MAFNYYTQCTIRFKIRQIPHPWFHLKIITNDESININ